MSLSKTWRTSTDSRFTVAPPPPPFFGENAGVATNSRPYLPKYGAPCHPDVIVQRSFANKKTYQVWRYFSLVILPVSSSYDTFGEADLTLLGEAIVESDYFSMGFGEEPVDSFP